MDLCDSCTHISCQGQETIWSVPTRIGKEPDSDVWRVAEESAGGALEGMVVEDKLLSLAMKDGTATIDGVRYEGLYLLKMFLKQVLAIPRQASGKEEIENLVITVPKLEVKLVDCLMYCADFLEIDRSRVHVISHAESFVYYGMSQKREVWSNQVGMFELSENGLHYYELRVQRGLRQMQVVADQEELEESFPLKCAGQRRGHPGWQTGFFPPVRNGCCRSACFQRHLTGRGFAQTDWAADFSSRICKRRRVFAEMDVFTRGALIRSEDLCEAQSAYQFTCICEGRLKTTVSLKIQEREKEGQLVLASAGDSWYETKMTAEFIVSGTPEVDFHSSRWNRAKRRR